MLEDSAGQFGGVCRLTVHVFHGIFGKIQVIAGNEPFLGTHRFDRFGVIFRVAEHVQNVRKVACDRIFLEIQLAVGAVFGDFCAFFGFAGRVAVSIPFF